MGRKAAVESVKRGLVLPCLLEKQEFPGTLLTAALSYRLEFHWLGVDRWVTLSRAVPKQFGVLPSLFCDLLLPQ